MRLARPKTALLDHRGLKLRASPIAMMGAAIAASKNEVVAEAEAMKRAKLMLAVKANLYFSADIPEGKFFISDPETLDPAERLDCPFTAKTLVLNPDDLDQALRHFQKAKVEGNC